MYVLCLLDMCQVSSVVYVCCWHHAFHVLMCCCWDGNLYNILMVISMTPLCWFGGVVILLLQLLLCVLDCACIVYDYCKKH